MDTTNLEFMSIGGNCASFAYLPEKRNKGPVDNFQANKGILSSAVLFNNILIPEIYFSKPIIKDRVPSFEGDSDKEYIFDNYSIVHANPYTEKYKAELERRMNSFNDFFINVKSKKNYYFTYSLDWYETSKYKGNVKDGFYEGIEMLKHLNILDKVIFVGTKNVEANNNWNFFFIEVPECIKYVELIDINVYHHGMAYDQFIDKLKAL